MANIGSPQQFAETVLSRLGIQPNRGNVKAIVGWAQAEGGHWHNTATFNPLNTTLTLPGSRPINSVGVKAYGSWDQGVHATVQTLRNGRYGGIIQALRSGNPGRVADAIGASPWGTSSSLIHSTIGRAQVGNVRPGAPAQPSAPKATGTVAAPQTDPTAARTSLIAQFVQQGGADNHQAVVTLASALPALNAQQAGMATRPVAATGQPGTSPAVAPVGSGPDAVRTLMERANQIASHHYNYEWGGGHNPSHAPTHGVGHGSGAGVGFDCSGAVSKVLGINPRVAAQFESWGQAGKGKHVTIYANGTHTFMEINGKFFGTSGHNPGGGAAWYTWHPDAAYLATFVARHPSGL